MCAQKVSASRQSPGAAEGAKGKSGPESSTLQKPEVESRRDAVQEYARPRHGGTPASQAKALSNPFLLTQQYLGNQAVLRRLKSGLDPAASAFRSQPQLRITTPHDLSEQEAHRVAEQIVVMRQGHWNPPSISSKGYGIQRKCACGGTCEDCKTQQPSEDEILQTKPANAGATNPGQLPPIVHQVLSSPGQPLDASTRSFMEPRFGHDFSQVRVHADAAAGESARAIQARAYTAGNQVVFDSGAYRPETHEGKELLAHELTHTLQQKDLRSSFGATIQALDRTSVASASKENTSLPTVAAVQFPFIQLAKIARSPVSNPKDPAELEAEETAKKVMRMREPPAPAPTIRKGIGKEAVQRADASPVQRQSTRNVLRHNGRWTDIDSPTVLGLWAKEAAINKLWLESTLQEVQEHPEKVSELVEAVLPKLRAALYSPKEFSGSPEARRDADEALQMRWPLPGVEGVRDQVLEEFLRRYTKQLEQALAHTPEGTELVTTPEEIWRVRHLPYDNIWWHRMEFIHKGQISPPREILDIKACPKGSEDRCARGDPLRDIWFILKRDPNWIYFSRDQRIDRFDWILQAVSGQVAESTQFAGELFPYLLKLAGFSLGLSTRLAFILAGEILNALGEQGVRAARGEKMQSALEVVKGIGFGVVTAHFLGHLFHKSPGRALEQNLEEATERAAARARVEVARTDASLVERELRAGRARAVDDPDLLADGYRIEVDVISEGQKHTWRLNTKGSWCRFSTEELCVRQLSDAVDDAARQGPPTIERDLATAGVSAQARRKLGKNTLSVDDIVAVHQAAQETETGWTRVAAAAERGDFELRIHAASEYGLFDYIRYHIRAPGLGAEGFPIPLARTWMNRGANEIEAFMRAQLKKAFTVEFNVTRTTFAGEELRPFFEDIIQRGSKKTLGRLATDSARIERFLKSITYDIRLYRRVGNQHQFQLWRATMETGPPPLGNMIRRGLPLERIR
jgi:hypothetical protein